MSEIKGQLLGIVLVLAVFGAVGAGLLAAFKTSGEKIVKNMSENDGLIPTTTENNSQIESSKVSNIGLLNF